MKQQGHSSGDHITELQPDPLTRAMQVHCNLLLDKAGNLRDRTRKPPINVTVIFTKNMCMCVYIYRGSDSIIFLYSKVPLRNKISQSKLKGKGEYV